MNQRKRAILFIAFLEALFFTIFTMLYVYGGIKLVTFLAVILTFSVVVNILLIIAIRKLPND